MLSSSLNYNTPTMNCQKLLFWGRTGPPFREGATRDRGQVGNLPDI